MNRSIIVILIAVLISGGQAKAQQANQFFPAKNLITTGIYYYPEHWNENQWERDIKKIAEMGYEFVHLAEFAWFRLEPEEGKFDFAWLDKVVALCEKHHVKVLMCTPSATMPAWMRDKYPETHIMYGNYIRGEHGTRGLGSNANTKYKFFVERAVAALAQHYGQNKNVVGWQLDNEPDAKTDYSPSAQTAFRQWLQRRYKTIDALNTAWGTAFWSQRYNSFNQVMIPNVTLVNWWGNNPHALLDLKRYSADEQADFLDLQSAVLRKYISPDQYITTNYTAVSPTANPRLTRKMDFATYTAYPNGGAGNMGNVGFRLGDSKTVLFAAEYYKSVGGFTGVMEMQPGPTNWATQASLLLPGTVRMWLYHSFAAGGKIACSYRFRQILYGAEQYHAGVIKTDGVTPSQGGVEYIQFNKEIRQLRQYYQPDAQLPQKLAARKTAIVWNLENYWTIDREKQNVRWDAWNYPVKFLEMAKSLGADADVVDEKADLSPYKVVIVPAYEMADPELIKKWTRYVEQGGHLIITCRTAAMDRNGHFWEGETAAPLSDLIGAHITNTDMIPPYSKGDILAGQNHYSWNIWADLLKPDDNTTVLANYNDQFYKGTAAVVKRNIGKGAVTYIGVVTDDMKMEKEILKNNYLESGADVENYPPGIYVYWRDGFYVAVNYSSDNYEMNIPGTGKILVGDKVLKPAGVLVWTE
ncbi:MAG: beta-galactosidase [Chitinophaga sp.]|uniref:beta-galactosidase n=1 Tax=Chitinophaga sp. TaxID=1869181 RepID=UPI001B2E0C70|nr:beta-galactosidase [Chitinophaga sp.]MBO9729756.1 beta-galactosidase [Chitinophaga sp.]